MKNIFVQLVSLANDLDKKGLYSEANRIDTVIKLFAGLEDDPFYDEPFEGSSKITNREANNIVDRYLGTPLGGEDVEVKVSGQRPDEIVTLKFPTGPDVTITGDDWDKLQVMMGIM
jgi:hypothetical protein